MKTIWKLPGYIVLATGVAFGVNLADQWIQERYGAVVVGVLIVLVLVDWLKLDALIVPKYFNLEGWELLRDEE